MQLRFYKNRKLKKYLRVKMKNLAEIRILFQKTPLKPFDSHFFNQEGDQSKALLATLMVLL